jgi:3-hydroxymyristoyl/3-hydroxydecanoyl-(acyl carrier protein) dehydratase
VGPGDTLEMEVTLGQMGARAGKGTGTARVDGQVAATVALLFVIVDA